MTPFGRQQIVEDAEHRLLHLAGICGAADQDQLLGEVDRDHRLAAACRGAPGSARKLGRSMIVIFGHEAGQLARAPGAPAACG